MKWQFKLTQRFLLKQCLIALTVFLSNQQLKAQSFVTVMLEQISKLELDLQQAKQGYDIVQKGLSTISDIKNGNFNLHSLFFNSLKNVNPAIKSDVMVADIIAMQIQIISNAKNNLTAFISTGSFSSNELTYFSSVFKNLENLTTQDIDELTNLVTDGNWQMSDDQRISQINNLYNQVSDKYDFLRSFSGKISRESIQRQKDKNSLQNLSKLFQP